MFESKRRVMDDFEAIGQRHHQDGLPSPELRVGRLLCAKDKMHQMIKEMLLFSLLQ